MSLSFSRQPTIKAFEERWREEGGTDGPFFLSRRTEGSKYCIELFEIILSRHVRYPQHQLGEDATCCPIIDSCTIATSAEEKFWRSVPSITSLYESV